MNPPKIYFDFPKGSEQDMVELIHLAIDFLSSPHHNFSTIPQYALDTRTQFLILLNKYKTKTEYE